jgi:glycosyltransferase involved in cell wall biosynthesis
MSVDSAGIFANIKNEIPTCRSLLFFLGGRSLYRETLISKNEIFCSPDTETNLHSAKTKALKTPVGAYDAATFLAEKKLPKNPEIILVKADATGRGLPSNLKEFKCPRVLLVGDTHHQSAPIRKMIEYAKQEAFDFIIFDHTRHHARWFFEAGLRNLHWIPALDFTFHPRIPSPNPKHPFSFVGQAGKFHPYRCHVIESLQKSGLPFQMYRGSPSEAADLYAESIVTLNVSLNGDLNLRVFEALAAGGFLLTDKLTRSSGLEILFSPGEDLEVWGSMGELIEKARFYLDKPAEADRIRRAGQQKLLEFHHPYVKVREFFDLVFKGKENPIYSLEEEASKARLTIQGVSLVPGVEAYEFLQELHRTSSPLAVWSAEESLEAANAFFADLPRVLVSSFGGTILFLSGGEASVDEMLTTFEGKWIVAPQNALQHLQEWGFSEVAKGVYEFAEPVARELRLHEGKNENNIRAVLPDLLNKCTRASQALYVAEYASRLEIEDLRKSALQRALFLDRNSTSALIQLADLCYGCGADPEAAILLNEASRIEKLPPEVEQLKTSLLNENSEKHSIIEYLDCTNGGAMAPPPKTLSILVVTNLFPPQELGGYGRKIWEFTEGLRKRGHKVLILAGDAPYLLRPISPGENTLEEFTRRELNLWGEWRNGVTKATGDWHFAEKTSHKNAKRVLEEVQRESPDFVLLGNLDFLGTALVKALIENKIPVLHSLGNQTPGYLATESMVSPYYWIAPASDWLGKTLSETGYHFSRLCTVYPGARVDRFFKYFLPDIRQLRIAFAGLVMHYKGAHVLLNALHVLHQSGVDFRAEIAGDSTDQSYINTLKDFIDTTGMSAKIAFTGFLDRPGLDALFARSNVLVFPTLIPEAFGISQVEAMASGVIVVTSGTGGTQEVVRHGIDGLVYENQNHISLAQALHSLHTNPQLRATLQVNARTRAFEFSVNKSVERIENLALEMLASVPSTPSKMESFPSQANSPIQVKATANIIPEIREIAKKSSYDHIPRDLDAIVNHKTKCPKIFVYRHERETGAPLFPMLRQTFFSRGIADGLEFSEESPEGAEYAVVFGGSSFPPALERFEKRKRICLLMENPKIWVPSHEYLSKMGVVVCPFPIDVPPGTRLILQQAAVPWFYGLKLRTDVGLMHVPKETSLQLQDLARMQMPEKTKLLSCISSKKVSTEGHRWRIQLAEALHKHFGKDIDLFGFGWNAVEEKQNAIDPYKFHIVIENDASEHYWTEKLSDAMLGYSIPIYAGASKAQTYFKGELFSIPHGGDVGETINKIQGFINKEYRPDDLYLNRNNILFNHNIYYALSGIIKGI